MTAYHLFRYRHRLNLHPDSAGSSHAGLFDSNIRDLVLPQCCRPAGRKLGLRFVDPTARRAKSVRLKIPSHDFGTFKMDLVLFFIQVGIMLSIALVFEQITRRFNQPAVLGELIGGVFLGPTVFGFFAPDAFLFLFPDQGVSTMGREAIINIGMLFFLFVAGLEVDLGQLRRSGSLWHSISWLS